MKLVGLLVTAAVLALLVFWWLSLSVGNTEKATTLPPEIEAEQINQGQTGTAPLDYSKEKIQEVNELNQERNEQVENLLR